MTWQSETSYDFDAGYPVQPAYTLASLMARYDINNNLRASLRENNVFDEEYDTGIADYGVYGAVNRLTDGQCISPTGGGPRCSISSEGTRDADGPPSS